MGTFPVLPGLSLLLLLPGLCSPVPRVAGGCPPEHSPCGDKFIIKSKGAAQIRGGRCGERGFRDETLGAERGSKEIGYAQAGAPRRNVHLFLNCYQLMCPLFLSASSPSKPPEQRDQQGKADPGQRFPLGMVLAINAAGWALDLPRAAQGGGSALLVLVDPPGALGLALEEAGNRDPSRQDFAGG